MNKLTIDYNFAVKEKLNAGITSEELEFQKGKAQKGLAILTDMVKNGSVGFPELPKQKLDEIKAIAKGQGHKYNDLVVIGIGGSALGFEAVVNALLPSGYNSLSFADRLSYPRYWLLDNADPGIAYSVLKYCNPEDTYVIVISKSGSTLETAINFSLVYEWLKASGHDMKKRLCIITDPSKGPLREFANINAIPNIALPSSIGGRFSVLSPVGLLPAALLGVDIEKLLAGAASVVEGDWSKTLTLAAIYMHFMGKRPINVLMPYSSRLVKFAEWYCQLWGESLGKRYTNSGGEVYFGTTPLRTSGAIDQHSQLQLFREGPDDKFITFISLAQHYHDRAVESAVHDSFSYIVGHKVGELLNTELSATEGALFTLSRPSVRLNIEQLDAYSLGQLFMLFQYITAVIGLANDIDPFNQPGVEEGKDFAYGLMGRQGFEHKREEFEKVYVKSPEFIV
ncbi:MAG: glucose-6-phosphate isomerase [Deferribacteraceae bacterium]|jgi:glucose-6-phosphate isomerase|nr:glucose-6-phosphate isomerase [Deferribacteraceae bacterium]